MEWIDSLSQMFNCSRSRLVQDFVKNPSVCILSWLLEFVTRQGKCGQHILLTVEHILLTILTFSVVIKVIVICNLPSTGKSSFSKSALNVLVSLSRRCDHDQKEAKSYTMQWSIVLLVTGVKKQWTRNGQVVTFLVAVFMWPYEEVFSFSKGDYCTSLVACFPSTFG